MANSQKVIAVQWNRFGPYHRARLNHLSTFAAERGIRIVAIETTQSDSLYSWKSDSGKSGFEHEILFTDRDYSDLKPSEISSAMRACLDRLQVDGVAIQSYSFPGARAALKWCRQNRKTAILMNVSRQQDAPRVAWRERIKRTLLAQFDAALLSGSQAIDYAAQLGFPRPYIFSGATVIDNQHFAPASVSMPLEKRERGFIVSSRFMPRKNLPLLIDAYEEYVSKVTQPWPLDIMGDGKGKEALEAMIRKANLEDHVQLLGFCDYQSLPLHYSRAKCLVHPASIDQWALVVNEAMAAGLPVIVSTGAGCHVELVEEGHNGFIFNPTDKETLTNLMIEMSKNERLNEMGQKSSEKISQWDLSRFSSRLIEAFLKGSTRSDRGLSMAGSLVFKTLEWTARDAYAFHTVDS